MARYRVIADSFIDGILYKAGDEVEYAGDRIGPNLKYLSGKKPKELYDCVEIAVDSDVDTSAPASSGNASSNSSSANGASNSTSSSGSSSS